MLRASVAVCGVNSRRVQNLSIIVSSCVWMLRHNQRPAAGAGVRKQRCAWRLGRRHLFAAMAGRDTWVRPVLPHRVPGRPISCHSKVDVWREPVQRAFQRCLDDQSHMSCYGSLTCTSRTVNRFVFLAAKAVCCSALRCAARHLLRRSRV